MRVAFLTHQIHEKQAELDRLHRAREDAVVAEAAKGIKLKVIAEQARVTPAQLGRIHKAGLKRL